MRAVVGFVWFAAAFVTAFAITLLGMTSLLMGKRDEDFVGGLVALFCAVLLVGAAVASLIWGLD